MAYGVTVNIRNIPETLARVDALEDRIRGKVMKALNGAAIDTQATAKMLCPVDTGRLRASIQAEMETELLADDMESRVGTSVEYAPYVEYGTYKMAADPFLFPAFAIHARSLVQELQLISQGK